MPAPRKDSKKFKQQFLETYKQLNCKFLATCRVMKINPQTVRNWRKMVVKKNGVEVVNEFDLAMKQIRDELNEDVEGSLVENALDPKGAPVSKIFYLKNNMKDKYGDNLQVDVQPSKLWFEKNKQLNEKNADT